MSYERGYFGLPGSRGLAGWAAVSVGGVGVTRRTTVIKRVAFGLVPLLIVVVGLYAWSSRQGAEAPPVIIAAAGDISCDPAYPDFNNGGGTAVGCHEKATADLIGTINPAAVLALGDIQYVHGTLANYAAAYDPSWGRFKSITRPVLGNHEGGEGGSNSAYFDYFTQNAGDVQKGYYSYDLGAWHLIALNSNCGVYSFNGSHDGCASGSPQDLWLKNDLASHPSMCSLAYFHVPRFSSGADHHSDAASDQTLTTLWTDLFAGGVDIILNGHAHDYERFAPLDPGGQIDQAHGIREFVVGTGGDDHDKAGPVVTGSEMRNSNSFGVLRFALRASSYDYQFVNDGTAGATNNDAGTAQCHS